MRREEIMALYRETVDWINGFPRGPEDAYEELGLDVTEMARGTTKIAELHRTMIFEQVAASLPRGEDFGDLAQHPEWDRYNEAVALGIVRIMLLATAIGLERGFVMMLRRGQQYGYAMAMEKGPNPVPGPGTPAPGEPPTPPPAA